MEITIEKKNVYYSVILKGVTETHIALTKNELLDLRNKIDETILDEKSHRSGLGIIN